MQMTRSKKVLSLILCAVLIAAMALFMSACSGSKNSGAEAVKADGGTLGEGKTQFTLIVADGEGRETSYTVKTDKETVGDALTELQLIAGEPGPYGLYIKTVDGISLDFDKDKKYWAFYVDGDYASSGVDTTAVAEGAEYSLRAES